VLGKIVKIENNNKYIFLCRKKIKIDLIDLKNIYLKNVFIEILFEIFCIVNIKDK